MRKFRIIVIILSVAIIIVNLFLIDFQNFISRPNLAAFLGIAAMILITIAMLLSNRHESKNQNNYYKKQ
jgi:predicted ferric reductase